MMSEVPRSPTFDSQELIPEEEHNNMFNENSQPHFSYDLDFYDGDNLESPSENLSDFTFQLDSDSDPSLSQIEIGTDLLSQECMHFIQSRVPTCLPGFSLGDIESNNGEQPQPQPQQPEPQQDYFNVTQPTSLLQLMENVAGPSHRVCGTGTRRLVRADDFDLPELVNWAGDMNFSVQPSDGGNGKKCIYWSEMEKLYVLRDYHIPFSFHLDYDKLEHPENYSISVQLVYTDSAHRDTPVLRCLVDMDKEKTSVNPGRIPHIVRCVHKSAVYSQSESTRRCMVICALEQLQPGVTQITRNYMFTCLSSCKSGELHGDGGIQRRAVAMVFLLLDEQKQVHGRFVFHVRVCSAPVRDYNKDRKDMNNTNKPKTKRKAKGEAEAEQNKVVRYNYNEDYNKVLSSSQETTYSDDETGNTIKLRSLMRDVKWALLQKRSENRSLKSRSKEVFTAIRLTKMLCDSMRRMDEENPKGSPDQGFQEDQE